MLREEQLRLGLKYLRLEVYKVEQTKICEKLGMEQPNYSAIENGNAGSERLVIKIYNKLGYFKKDIDEMLQSEEFNNYCQNYKCNELKKDIQKELDKVLKECEDYNMLSMLKQYIELFNTK